MDTPPDKLALLVAPGDTMTAVYRDTAASASIAGLKDISGSTIINGISPYTFTLVNSKTHEIGDVDYRITWDFGAPFTIVNSDVGLFDSARKEGEHTVIFHADELEVYEQRTGVVAVLFEDGGMADVSRTLTVDVVMTVRSISNEPISHEFQAEASVLASIATIIDVAQASFDFGWQVYEKVMPCLSMDDIEDGFVASFSPTSDRVSYALEVGNCSDHHAELVEFSVSSQLPPGANPNFNPRRFDIDSNALRRGELFFLLPKDYQSTGQVFDVRATALLCIFGNCYTMSYAEGTTVLVPEFPTSFVFIVTAIMIYLQQLYSCDTRTLGIIGSTNTTTTIMMVYNAIDRRQAFIICQLGARRTEEGWPIPS
jgi:hypothetical protein